MSSETISQTLTVPISVGPESEYPRSLRMCLTNSISLQAYAAAAYAQQQPPPVPTCPQGHELQDRGTNSGSGDPEGGGMNGEGGDVGGQGAGRRRSLPAAAERRHQQPTRERHDRCRQEGQYRRGEGDKEEASNERGLIGLFVVVPDQSSYRAPPGIELVSYLGSILSRVKKDNHQQMQTTQVVPAPGRGRNPPYSQFWTETEAFYVLLF